jgi:hypothetical protein
MTSIFFLTSKYKNCYSLGARKDVSTLYKILYGYQDHSWKENVVRSIFMPFDADALLRIRLPNYDGEDFIS